MSKLSIAIINLYYKVTQHGVLILGLELKDCTEEYSQKYIQEIKNIVSKADFNNFENICQLITDGIEIPSVIEYFSSVKIENEQLNIFFKYLFDWIITNRNKSLALSNKILKLKKKLKLKNKLSIIVDDFKSKFLYLLA